MTSSLPKGSIQKVYLHYIGVSKNRGTPKSSILIGFSTINHPFCGAPIFGNTHIYLHLVDFAFLLFLHIPCDDQIFGSPDRWSRQVFCPHFIRVQRGRLVFGRQEERKPGDSIRDLLIPLLEVTQPSKGSLN